MSDDDVHRVRARQAIRAARRGHLPKPMASPNSACPETPKSHDQFEKISENTIEYEDEQFGRSSILTRSARMRKFKFYQFKPVQDTPKSPENPIRRFSSARCGLLDPDLPQTPHTPIVIPRQDAMQGKLALAASQSAEHSQLDEQINELERKIADLNNQGSSNSNNNNNNLGTLDTLFELVNKKNDLLRRQMQLNIQEQERALEKTNEELTKELRSLVNIEDWRKTSAQLERQKYLYDQTMALVNKRNELVLHMDEQERAIEDDNALKATLKTVIADRDTRNRINGQADQNCTIQ